MTYSLIDNIYNKLTATDVLDDAHLICECSCGKEIDIYIPEFKIDSDENFVDGYYKVYDSGSIKLVYRH